MKNLIKLIFVLLILTSCAVYTPQVSPPILIEEKGDVQLNFGGNISSALISPGLNAAITYGFTDKIQVQLYTSYISSGTAHFQFLAGYNLKLNEKANIRLFGGYFYGIGDVKYMQILSHGSPNYIGNYQSYFGKIQFSKFVRKNNIGLTFTVGHFQPNYTVKYENNTGFTDFEINQKGLLLDPSIYFNWNFSDKLGLTFTYSNAWIKPLDQINIDSPNNYELDYNYYGNFGISLKYLIRTGYNRKLSAIGD